MGEKITRTDDLLRVALEGWRMSALLLDQTVPNFSWRSCVLAFMQSDKHCRGFLDPHEVHEAEHRRLHVSAPKTFDAAGLRVLDETSLGAFVFRAVHRCTKAQAANETIP